MNKGSHAPTLTSAAQCLLFSALNIPAGDFSGICLDSRKKEELLCLTHKSQWITASRQREEFGTLQEGWNVVAKTLPLSLDITGISVCLSYTIARFTFPYWCLINLPPPWYYQFPTTRVSINVKQDSQTFCCWIYTSIYFQVYL